MDSVGFPYNNNKEITPAAPDARPMILVSIPSYLNLFYAEVLQGIYASADVHGYSVLVSLKAITPANINEFLLLLNTTHCAGLITLDPMSPDLFKTVADSVPTIQCCEALEDIGIPYVTIDDYASAKTAVKYLLSRGYRDIGIINGPLRFKFARERQHGYEDALKEAGLTPVPSRTLHLADVNYNMGLSAVTQMLSSDRPEALFCVIFASAAIKAANQLGLSVPDDISIMGFDNTDPSIMSVPPISTINQPRFQLGYMSGEVLHDFISNGSIASQMRSITLPTELIIRESTK